MIPLAPPTVLQASTVLRAISTHRARLHRSDSPLATLRGGAYRRDHAESLRSLRILRDSLLSEASCAFLCLE
jgi:hypothetical protein